MAQIFPSDIEAAKASGESPEELETLIALRDGLPDEYLVYHSVHWSAVRPCLLYTSDAADDVSTV